MKTEITRLFEKRRATKGAPSHRRTGDDARDHKEWGAAETEYGTHLAQSPADQPIWVQYGHCLKEQGKRTEAEAAYRRAIELRPDDADAHLQLGHLLKLLGRREEAQQSYLSSVELNPSKATIEEVTALAGADAGPGFFAGSMVHDSAETIYLEIDDLLDYLRNHRTVSGIQRVQVGVIQHAISVAASQHGNYAFVRTGRHATGLWKLDPSDLEDITDYIKQSSVSQARLLSMIERAEQRATLVEPVRGQAYFVLGAFWGFGSNAARYATLKRAGLLIGVYIYDLIPLTHPEYCSAGTVSEFAFALGDGLHVFDFILTISEYIPKDVRRFLVKHNLRPIPVEAVLLAHQLHDAQPHVPAQVRAAPWAGAIAPLQGRPFVLSVSTIEPRKNHIYLYQVWKALLEEGLNPPDLVLVGRFGWRVNDLREMMRDTGFLGGRIHVLHDVDLELLYRSCLFTAFPSITEGWGLPVGESLTHGRPCVASSTSSVPEVGGEFADYIDPWNLRDGIRVFKQMMFDDTFREKRTRNIQSNFVARTWNDVGEDLLDRLAKFRKLPATPYVPPRLEPGELLVVGDLEVTEVVPCNYASRPLRPILAVSWFSPEPTGAWLKGNEGSLWFSTSLKPGTRVIAYLHLKGAPWSSNHLVKYHIGQDKQVVKAALFPTSVQTENEAVSIKANRDFVCRAAGTVGEDSTVLISFFVQGEAVLDHSVRHAGDDRIFYVGLVKAAYAAAADVELRVDLSERFMLLP